MQKQENLSITELEALAKAYIDCKLSRQQEKELELVLLSSRHRSPLIDDCRRIMVLQELLVSTTKSDSISDKKITTPIWWRKSIYRISAAASIAILVSISVILWNRDSGNRDKYLSQSNADVSVYVNGEKLGHTDALSAAITTQQQSMLMMNEIINETRQEESMSLRQMTEIKNSK